MEHLILLYLQLVRNFPFAFTFQLGRLENVQGTSVFGIERALCARQVFFRVLPAETVGLHKGSTSYVSRVPHTEHFVCDASCGAADAGFEDHAAKEGSRALFIADAGN